MTQRLDESNHFLPTQELPEFEGSVPILDVFKELSVRHRGAFIYHSADADYFIKANRLAETLFADQKQARGVAATRDQAELSLQQALGGRMDPGVVIRIPNAVDVSVAPEPLQNRTDMVFLVVEGNRPLGWFINHENLLDPATERVYFVCKNGHKNPDPDHGTCYSCPFPIIGTSK